MQGGVVAAFYRKCKIVVAFGGLQWGCREKSGSVKFFSQK